MSEQWSKKKNMRSSTRLILHFLTYISSIIFCYIFFYFLPLAIDILILTLIIIKKSYLLFYSKYYYHIFFIYRYYFIFQKIIKSIYYYIDFIIIKLYQAINYKCIQKSLLLKIQELIFLQETL